MMHPLKLDEITAIFNEQTEQTATREEVQSNLYADWQTQEYKDWLEIADPQDIAEYLAAMYREWEYIN